MMRRALALCAALTGAHALRSAGSERCRLFEDGARFPGAATLDAGARRLPAVVAAEARGRLAPKLRFARHVLGVQDASALVATPFASIPLPVLAARHAYLRRLGARSGAALRAADVALLCERPAAHDAFAAAVGGDAAAVEAVVRSFRRGGRRACADGDADLAREFLAHGWSPAGDRDRRGASAIHAAAGRGRTRVLQVLLDAGAPPDDRGGDGATPLHWASCGVDGNAVGVGGELEAMAALLARGADAAAATDDGNAVVHWAAWAGGPDAVRLLLRQGADAAVANDRGCTAAHWACAGGDVETLDLLRGLDVDLEARNAAGHTPLEHAVAYDRRAVVDYLLKLGLVDDGARAYAAQIGAVDASRAPLAATLAAYTMPPL